MWCWRSVNTTCAAPTPAQHGLAYTTAWALAKAAHSDRFGPRGHGGNFKAQELADSAWAFATVAHSDAPRGHGSNFKAQELANTA